MRIDKTTDFRHKSQPERPVLKPVLEEYLAGARTLYFCIVCMRNAQIGLGSPAFFKAMNMLENDLTIALRKRFEELGPTAGPSALKEFEQLLAANLPK